MSGWILIAVAAGASTGLYLSVAMGSISALVLAYMASLPLFLLGLAKGWASVLAASVASAIAVAFITGIPSAAMHAIAVGFPAVVLVQRALLARSAGEDPATSQLEWYPPGMLVMWLVALPSVVLMAATLYFLGSVDGFRGAVAHFVDQVFSMLSVGNPDAPGAPGALEGMTATKALLAEHLPGWGAVLWALLLMLNASVAQAGLSRFGHNLRPAPDMTDIQLPNWAPFPLMVAVGLGYVMDGPLGYLGINLIPVLALPFFISGLGFVHAVLPRNAGRRLLLMLCYSLAFTVPWVAKAVVMLGLADQVFELRRRIVAKTPPGGT